MMNNRKPVKIIEALTLEDYHALRTEDTKRIKAEIAATETESDRQKRAYSEQRARERSGKVG